MDKKLKKPPIFVEHRKKILISLVAFVSFGFSVLSSFYVQSLGCGLLNEIIDCGFYAGFPVPFANFKTSSIKNKEIAELLNPTYYYKYKYSPLSKNRKIAEKLLAQGKIFPFYLQKQEVYVLNKGILL